MLKVRLIESMMEKILIHPKAGQWVIPMPEGIMVDLKGRKIAVSFVSFVSLYESNIFYCCLLFML
jgi:hypothetical protein